MFAMRSFRACSKAACSGLPRARVALRSSIFGCIQASPSTAMYGRLYKAECHGSQTLCSVHLGEASQQPTNSP